MKVAVFLDNGDVVLHSSGEQGGGGVIRFQFGAVQSFVFGQVATTTVYAFSVGWAA